MITNDEGRLSGYPGELILIEIRWWAESGGTAIPDQPVVRMKQASITDRLSKNQFNILGNE